ncbi:MAG: biopolymer transporter ExbD [Deltaproteobacteria bacterium]|nr:biopolymer transporter ExbD [Nannocystaceae bacterium]
MSAGPVDDDDEITGINVTPLVDITLVLLIIFMVTTSVISNTEGMGISKPESTQTDKLEGATLVLACTSDGQVSIDGVVMDDAALVETITDRLAANRDLMGVVQCDEAAQVGLLVHLMDVLRDSGVKKQAVATKRPEAAGG